jgi:hypothetical protein
MNRNSVAKRRTLRSNTARFKEHKEIEKDFDTILESAMQGKHRHVREVDTQPKSALLNHKKSSGFSLNGENFRKALEKLDKHRESSISTSRDLIPADDIMVEDDADQYKLP